jgi:RND superfamily putative drug exporter
MERTNLAGRAGRWSAAHWKTAFFGWLVFVFVAVFVGMTVGTNKLLDSNAGDGESGRAQKILGSGDFKQPASESVLIQNSKLFPIGDRAFRSTIQDVVSRLSKVPEVTHIVSPLAPAIVSEGQISKDQHSAIVRFDIKGKAEDAHNNVQGALDATAAAQRAHPDFVVEEFGDASAQKALDKTLGSDFKRAEKLAVPATLIILLFAFGSLVAATVPVLLAFSGVLAAIGLSALVSQAVAASGATQSVILLVGLAVGVDYSLFYLKREREERARGMDPHTALLHTASTSGQAVLISGATVFVAVAGMLVAGDPTFRSISLGTMIVVAVAIIGSLSVLPALMHRLGDNIERGRIPFLHREASAGGSRAWSAILRPVLRHPTLSVVLSAGLLVALAIPAFSLSTKFPSITDLPPSIPIVKTFDRVEKAFPGSPVPMVIAVKGSDLNTVQMQQAVLDLRDRALATGKMTLPIDISLNPSHTIERITLPIASTDSRSPTAYAALRQMRKQIIPATIGTVPGVEVAVGGETAGNRDFNDLMRTHLPLVFFFVLGLAFLLLLMTFRSIVIPIKAIVLNLLSVGAAYGILVLVFQNTWAEGILSFRSNGGVASWLPLFLFVLLFGLSMDYHVFIVSRIKELVDGGMATEEAVERGIVSTAGTVTSAAIVMVAVFGIFASLSQIDIKQMGFGLAVAILIDATIVRAVLLPATMKLLGKWNWYLPTWLEWVPNLSAEPRVSHEGEARRARPAVTPG